MKTVGNGKGCGSPTRFVRVHPRSGARASRGPILRPVVEPPQVQVDDPTPETVESMVDAVPGSLWDRIQEDPARAPEHIALAAAKRFAPAAERFVAEHGRHHPPPGLARMAIRRHVTAARLEGAAAGVGGALTTVPDLAALAWIQCRMVFFVAAAHGFDPHHPMRPAELLCLQGFYETPMEARAALDGLGKPMAIAFIESRVQRDEAIARRLVKILGQRIARRVAGRFIPFLAIPIASIQNARATQAVGNRALVYYGGG
jgi:EcsC family protein